MSPSSTSNSERTLRLGALRIHPRVLLCPLLVAVLVVGAELLLRALAGSGMLPRPNLYGINDMNVKVPAYQAQVTQHGAPEVVIVGNSVPLSALEPRILGAQTGRRTHNLCIGGTTFTHQRELHDLVFDDIAVPPVLVLGVCHVAFRAEHPHNRGTRRAWENSAFVAAVRQPPPMRHVATWATTSLELLRQRPHFTASLLHLKSPFVPREPDAFVPDGFLVRSETPMVIPIPAERPAENLANSIQPANPEWKAFAEFVLERRAAGQQVVVVNVPYAPVELFVAPTVMTRYRALLEVWCLLNGVPYIDGQSWPDLNERTDFADAIHMTGEGGRRLSRWLAGHPVYRAALAGDSPTPVTQAAQLATIAEQCQRNNTPQAAAIVLLAAHQHSPQPNVQYLLLAADQLRSAWDLEGAVEVLATARELYPNEALPRTMEIELLAALGRRSEALQLMDEAARRLGEDATLRELRATLTAD